jgi:hypothetical protein
LIARPSSSTKDTHPVRHLLLSSLTLALALAVAPAPTAQAGEVALTRAVGGVFHVPIRSLKEARFARVIKQEYDFSCGSAALATLLTYHYEKPVTEADVFTAMFEVGDQDRIKKLGFSLLDMKKYLDAKGIRADGFKVSLERLEKLGVPAIGLIDTGGYKHFVVVKGIEGNDILLGDPARGTRKITREEFQEIWNGIAFVIRDQATLGRQNFNHDEDWSVLAHAPFGTAMSRQTLSSFSVHLKNTLANTF